MIFLPLLVATVITGNATAETNVSTVATGGSASVTTNITTEVNGQKYTVTSTEPGTLRVQHYENGIVVEKNGSNVSTITPVKTNDASPIVPDQPAPSVDQNAKWTRVAITQLNTVLTQIARFFYWLVHKTP